MSKVVIASLTSIIIILLVGLGVFIYLTQFTATAKAKHTASAYMQAVRSNNPQAVGHLSKLDQTATNRFFHQASLRDYRLTTVTEQGNKFYFVYSFTDQTTPKKARLSISQNQVTAATTGDKLGATPQSDSPEETATNTDSSTCLTSEDLAFIDSKDIYAHTFRAMTMIFASNTSMNYAGEKNGEHIINRLVSFYKRSSQKDYLIELRGYASDDPQAYITMSKRAQNRADKIRQELIAKGITPDRIQISKPTIYPNDPDKTDHRRAWIDINIINQCR